MESKNTQWQSTTLNMVITLYAMVTTSIMPVLCKVTLTTNDIKMNSSPLSAADSHREDSPTHQDL